jgi:hypothetical protein
MAPAPAVDRLADELERLLPLSEACSARPRLLKSCQAARRRCSSAEAHSVGRALLLSIWLRASRKSKVRRAEWTTGGSASGATRHARLRRRLQQSAFAWPALAQVVQPGRVKSTSPDASFHAEAVGRRALLEGYRRRGTPLRSRRERDLGHTRGRGPRDPVGTRRCKPGRDLGSTRAAECTVDACISPSSRLPAKPAVEGASGLRGRRRRHLPAAQLAS